MGFSLGFKAGPGHFGEGLQAWCPGAHSLCSRRPRGDVFTLGKSGFSSQDRGTSTGTQSREEHADVFQPIPSGGL